MAERPELDPAQRKQDIEDCPICNYPYADNFERTPRVLPCGHTYCTSCIDRMLLQTSIRCPLCTAVHRVPQADPLQFPANYAVMQVLLENRPEQAVRDLCECCNEREATLVCVNCAPPQLFRFCDICDDKEHNRGFRPAQLHRRYPIHAIPAHVRTVFCSTHPQQGAVFYSIKHDVYSCHLCKADPSWPDRSQDALPIEEAARKVRIEARKINQYSYDYYQRLNNTQHEITKIMNQLTPSANAAKEEIQRKFNELADIIKKRQEELMSFVEQELEQRKTALQDQHEKVSRVIRELVSCRESLNQLVPKSDIEFLGAYNRAKRGIDTLLTNKDPSLQRLVAPSGSIPVFFSNIADGLKVFGAIGGGPVPQEITCNPDGNLCNLMELQWILLSPHGDILSYEIEYENLPIHEEKGKWSSNGGRNTEYYFESSPVIIEGHGNALTHHIDYLCPGYAYRFRVRSKNPAGWGMWSPTVMGKCCDFPVEIGRTGKIHRVRIPKAGHYRITAVGAKAEDGLRCRGGRGAIITATFFLQVGDVLVVLSGGKSHKQFSSTGGGGGSFVALNEISQENLLVVAGGGGGTRGLDEDDRDGCDASLETFGTDGRGREHGKGGVDGGPGEDASNFERGCWGYGGAGALVNSSTAHSFLDGGTGGQCGGFGGGGGVSMYGGGGGGGYSGGGGGRGGGGGGSYVRGDGRQVKRAIMEVNPENNQHGSVKIEIVAPDFSPPATNHPTLPSQQRESDTDLGGYNVVR